MYLNLAKEGENFLFPVFEKDTRNLPKPKLVEDYQSILGKNDLNDSLHGQWTRIILDRFNKFHQNFLKTNNNQNSYQFTLTNEEIEILQICCEVHDWGEYAKGDINYDQKTESDEKFEKVERDVIINEFLNKKYSQDQILKITQIISSLNPKEQVSEEVSKLRLIFNTIERIGYLRTALKAWKGFFLLDRQEYLNRKNITPIEAKILKEACLTATVNVILNQLEILLKDRAKTFPYIEAFLARHQKDIESIFAEVNHENLQIYHQAFAIYPVIDTNSKNTRGSKINNFELARSVFKKHTLQD